MGVCGRERVSDLGSDKLRLAVTTASNQPLKFAKTRVSTIAVVLTEMLLWQTLSTARDGHVEVEERNCASRSGTAEAGRVKRLVTRQTRFGLKISGDAAAGAEIAGAGTPGRSPPPASLSDRDPGTEAPTRRACPVRVDRGLKDSLGLLGCDGRFIPSVQRHVHGG